jgi:hypothetical protein
MFIGVPGPLVWFHLRVRVGCRSSMEAAKSVTSTKSFLLAWTRVKSFRSNAKDWTGCHILKKSTPTSDSQRRSRNKSFCPAPKGHTNRERRLFRGRETSRSEAPTPIRPRQLTTGNGACLRYLARSLAGRALDEAVERRRIVEPNGPGDIRVEELVVLGACSAGCSRTLGLRRDRI